MSSSSAIFNRFATHHKCLALLFLLQATRTHAESLDSGVIVGIVMGDLIGLLCCIILLGDYFPDARAHPIVNFPAVTPPIDTPSHVAIDIDPVNTIDNPILIQLHPTHRSDEPVNLQIQLRK